jgi:hypothetical protein
MRSSFRRMGTKRVNLATTTAIVIQTTVLALMKRRKGEYENASDKLKLEYWSVEYNTARVHCKSRGSAIIPADYGINLSDLDSITRTSTKVKL